MLTAFPQRQWLHYHALIVTFTYIGCLVAVYSCLAHRVKTEQWPVQVCAVTAHSCDSQHHEQSKPMVEITGPGWRTFYLQQSTVCACCIPHGCAAERSSSTTHFSIRPVRSPDLLVFLRGNEALPQIVPKPQKAMLVFPG